jgi:hypothetical protein
MAASSAMIRRAAPAALLPPAAFVVHQLRYWLAFQGAAGAELQRTGHAYMHSVLPWVVALVGLCAGAFLTALGRALGGRRSLPTYAISFVVLWLICATALIGLYVCQESLEGIFVAGHPAGLVGIFGYGGWWAMPAALATGLVLAAALMGARWVIAEVAWRCGARTARRRRRPLAPPHPRSQPVSQLAPIAGGWSGRGPPR